MIKMGIPNGGQLPLDFFVIGESTPIPVINMDVGGAFL